ncbi:MAG: radical SAM protein [Bacteroidales bacterium]
MAIQHPTYPSPSRRNFLRRLGGLAFFLLPSAKAYSWLDSSRSYRFQSESSGVAAKSAIPLSSNSAFEPRYLELHRSGELKRRGQILWEMMNICDLCPRECENNRLDGQKGDCGSTSQLVISSFHPHFGEERPLVGEGGSGTIFMTHCSLRCVYCINWEISMGGRGKERSIDDLAAMMIRLQEIGCKNINVVTPTHYSPHILLALDKAAGKGLRLPLVYNTSGYEKVEVLKLLDGIVDIYMPDFKYFRSSMAAKYSSGAREYPKMAKAALLEMHRQVGVAKPANDGLMYKGLMIRHLVLPNDVSGTKEVIAWVADNLPKDTYFHLMAQYQPNYEADEYPQINRRITNQEYRQAIQHANRMGLTNLNVQGA